ncbi:patellin-3-like [Dorcoceras hygrometricum]|uniref:Patellin-3-like n=1 Tax=Dorcoceras hygrometricum TaxID=472368 RepID=A0A2Z7BRV4_9LAMI|nr:patellin-3-like [Dorcoceras hygrometricum]
MAEETKKTTAEVPSVAEEVAVSDVPVAEKPETTVVEKEPPKPESELEKVEKPAPEEVLEAEKEKGEAITERHSPNMNSPRHLPLRRPPQKRRSRKLKRRKKKKQKPEEKKEEEPKTEKKAVEEPPKIEEKTEGTTNKAPADVPRPPTAAEPVKEEASGKKVEEKAVPPPAAAEPSAVEKVEEKPEAVAEEIKETIVHEVTAPAPLASEEPVATPMEEEEKTPLPPDEVSLWGVSLLADEKTDVVLLKFLRARDFKVKEAFSMLKNVVAWRKVFKIDALLEEEGIGAGLEKVVYIHGVDREGHPVRYNAFGEFQDKELYNNTFADSEKRTKFLRWYIQSLEKNVKNLDFSPDGTCTFVQITDLKNSPGLILLKKELRQATNQALQLLQDNYPEFVAKQVFINVPWWYLAYNRMISPFLTQRTKSKFVFAGPTKTTETLFKYIAPEQVPIQYGGLSKEGDQEFTTADPATEEIIKPSSKHTVELPISEASTLVWEVRVVGWDVSYGAEFVPSAEGGYTWIVQKPRKIASTDEQAIFCSFKIGEPGKVVLTFDNQTSKKKKLLYRSKTKPAQ